MNPLMGIAAPPLQVAAWLNTPAPLTLQGLRGRVVVLHAFQMLCPGCVAHGLPQALRISATFASEQVTVIGLHTVFEHHAAMTKTALRAFLHEYRITLPVAIDAPVAGSPVPATMQAYGMRGTPSLVVIDAAGVVQLNHFGAIDDLLLGALLGRLTSVARAVDGPGSALSPAASTAVSRAVDDVLELDCSEAGCPVGEPPRSGGDRPAAEAC
jgi:hypothetical protein